MDARQAMIDGQLRPNHVNNDTVIKAFECVERRDFLPANLRGVAYVDCELSLGINQRHAMEPRVLGRLLEAAAVKTTDTALVLCCGLGYSVALLNQIVASAVGVEPLAPLRQKAQERLDPETVVLPQCADANAHGPFSLVLVEGAVQDLEKVKHDALQAGLTEKARLLLVSRPRGHIVGIAMRLDWQEGEWHAQKLFDAHTSLLTEYQRREGFTFASHN